MLGPTYKGRWSYACSKAIDEFLALAYWKERRLPTVIGRLFNTVGPRQTGRYGMVVPNFVRQALAEPADHRLRRRHAAAAASATSHDVVRALADLMERDDALRRGLQHRHRRRRSRSRELAERVRELDRLRAPRSSYVPYDEAYEEGFEDMQRRIPDITKIRDAHRLGADEVARRDHRST